MDIKYRSIGVVHSPFKEMKGTPIQPSGGRGVEGTVEVFPEFSPGLKDLDGFSHIILLTHLHLCDETKLMVVPYMDVELRGIFATRAPCRPNPIGISVVRLMSMENNILKIMDLDIVDGTPVLDIKPYVPELNPAEDVRIGWLSRRVQRFPQTRDDGRFTSV